MSLCDAKGEFLFRVLPDEFPQGYLTDAESLLWSFYYEKKNRELEKNEE